MHKDGPCLTLAGPGAGKTTVLTRRIQYLILEHQVPPENILVITFTRAAAMEMKERFENLMRDNNSQVVFGTFHSIFYHMLCESFHYSSENILSEKRKIELLMEAAARADVLLDCQKDAYGSLFREFSIVTNSMNHEQHYEPVSFHKESFYRLYQEYQKLKQQYHLLEFDDMIMNTYQMLKNDSIVLKRWQRQFSYILIDEIQDINPLQLEIIKLLSQPLQNLFVVGDDDQSIYGFRGASSELMLSFPTIYPNCTKITLETNYRSDSSIVKAALKLIEHNEYRFSKEIIARSKEIGCISHQKFLSMEEEHRCLIDHMKCQLHSGVRAENIAVLYRTNTQAFTLMEDMTVAKIPFHMKEKTTNIYRHWIILDILSYLKIAVGIGQRGDFLRICNRPLRYISRESIDDKNMTFDKWKSFYIGYDRMVQRIEELENHVRRIKHMVSYAAINYIRRGIAYDDFLISYAREKEMKMEDLLNIADYILESAKKIPDKRQLIGHIEEMAFVVDKQNKLQRNLKTSQRGVGLYTFHGAKGLEFDSVYIIDVNEGIMPSKKALSKAEIEEERRMFYVAITRAKHSLYLYSIEKRNNEVLYVSRFIEEMEIKEAES